MIRQISIPELVNDVTAFIESRKKWEYAKKFPNFISKHKKKYQEFIKCMTVLQTKYKREYQPKNNSNLEKYIGSVIPSAPPLDEY